MRIKELSNGTLIETDSFLAFFGKKNSEVDSLKSSFTNFQFRRIKQVHGNTIVESTVAENDFDQIADAHFTKQEQLGLCVITADCMPVLIYCHSPRLVCAIHAGWRGVANRVVPTSIQKLLSLDARAEDLSVLIGPHILENSFEVDLPVEEELLRSANVKAEEVVRRSGEKSYVDLRGIVFAQLGEFEISPEQAQSLYVDTKTNLEYHSFRRDKDRSGRNVSFIAMK